MDGERKESKRDDREMRDAPLLAIGEMGKSLKEEYYLNRLRLSSCVFVIDCVEVVALGLFFSLCAGVCQKKTRIFL
jgi:hypothetical protein